jgi:hypothetical protein
LIPPEELRHLSEGSRDGEKAGGAGLVEVVVGASGDVGDLLIRCREVLRTVLEVTGEEWSSDGTWSKKLPDWFVQGCVAEQSAEEAAKWLAWWRGLDDEARARAARERPWSLSDWLHWLQPDERQWYWWDGVAHGQHEARILVEVPGWPVALGALEWLLRVAGADSVEVVEGLIR